MEQEKNLVIIQELNMLTQHLDIDKTEEFDTIEEAKDKYFELEQTCLSQGFKPLFHKEQGEDKESSFSDGQYTISLYLQLANTKEE